MQFWRFVAVFLSNGDFEGTSVPFFFMFNSIQLFGVLLLGGLASGELSRRAFAVPRTSGYVVFGLLVGQSGLGWITPYHIESAQLFIDLALGLILFELGYRVPLVSASERWRLIGVGLVVALVTGGVITLALLSFGFAANSAVFAAALCLATSPAITIATCGDVGAKGKKTDLLFSLVAINGCVAFVAIALTTPFLLDAEASHNFAGIWEAVQKVCGAATLGAACAGLSLIGAELLGKRAEHQHLLLLGTIVLGVGTASYFDISVLLPMLIFGYITRSADREKRVVAIRIDNDARIFLVITFVLAGAALDIGVVTEYWAEALLVVAARFLGQALAVLLNRNRLDLSAECSIYLSVGLQPMSSVALVLLANTQMLYSGLDPRLAGTLLATILLMQLFGPLATQTAVKGFGEATRLGREYSLEEKPAAS